VQNGEWVYAADAGSINALAVTLSPVPAAYTTGMTIQVKVANTNSGASTINVNGLGTKNITYTNLSAIGANALFAGGAYTLIYDGTRFQLINPAVSPNGRLKLTTAIDYYVDKTSGSDSNAGTSSGAGNAWQTLQHAWNWLQQNIDANGQTITIHCADSATAYAPLSAGGPLVGSVGPQSVIIVGNTTTPANCPLAGTTGNAVESLNSAAFTIKGFKLTAPSGIGLYASGARIVYQNIDFGACSSYQVNSVTGSVVLMSGPCTVSGGAQCHATADGASFVMTGQTLTLTGTPAFSSSFARAQDLGILNAGGMTFSGTATGSRYFATQAGVIATQGAATTYLPGDRSGPTATGGQYV
jgi:hypothetical protein